MLIELAELSENQVYHTLIQTLIPRPVAWVLSDNGNGSHNLAPFSYFAGVSSKPPLLMISVGKKPDGSFKDTRVNIEARSHFVVHIAHRELAATVTETSRTLPHGESELSRTDLELIPFEGFDVPRVGACRVAYACERYAIQEMGDVPQSLVFGRILRIYVDDDAVALDDQGRTTVHANQIDPVARLGGNEYATFGDVIAVPRPK